MSEKHAQSASLNNQHLTLDHLRLLEKLSNLSIDDSENELYLASLEKILHMFDLLDSIDSSCVNHLKIQQVKTALTLRSDTDEPADNTQILKQCCPAFNDETQHILVPQVIETSDLDANI